MNNLKCVLAIWLSTSFAALALGPYERCEPIPPYPPGEELRPLMRRDMHAAEYELYDLCGARHGRVLPARGAADVPGVE